MQSRYSIRVCFF